MSNSDTYQYSPLSSTRLLLLQPGAPGSDIHCRLTHTTLKECHDDIYENYTALSYAWGGASQTRAIFIDKRPFEITINLAAALDDLRHQHTILRLWADAICIDQSNISERNHQVGLMRDIYSYAQHTVIHLGDSNDDCDQVMNAALQGPLSSHLQRLLALQILSRPWFMRVWIFQELVLSKDPCIQCGRKRIGWDVLHGSLRKGRDFRTLSWSDIPGNEEDDGERMKVTHAIEKIESEEEEDENYQSSRKKGNDLTMNEEEDGERTEVSHAIEKIESEKKEDEKSQSSSEIWSRSRMLVTDIIELKKRSWKREENSDYRARLNESALIERFYDMNAARRSYTTLFTVMLGRRGSRATDLRDLVYGYLAVARLPSKRYYPPCPVVDYRKSVVDVFTKATTYMLEKDSTYEVLQQTDVCNPSIRLKELPSWVPDWSLDSSQYLPPLPVWTNAQIYYEARHIWGNKFTSEVRGNVCILRCNKMDTVRSTSNIIPLRKATPQLHSEVSELYKEMNRNDWSHWESVISPSIYCDAHQMLKRILGGNLLDTLPDQWGEFLN